MKTTCLLCVLVWWLTGCIARRANKDYEATKDETFWVSYVFFAVPCVVALLGFLFSGAWLLVSWINN